MTYEEYFLSNFFKRFDKARIKKSMTKKEVAEKVGISRMTIGNWKYKAVIPLATTVVKIAYVLDVPSEHLLCMDFYEKRK